MSKLVLSMGGVVHGEYELDKERMTIGRKHRSDIQIDNLAVSGNHALVITILEDSFIEDLGSTNGTYVNGKPIRKHSLRNGDVISIGKHELKYINECVDDDDDDFEKTMIIRPGSATAAIALNKAAEKAVSSAGGGKGAERISSNAGSSMPLGKLTVLNGPVTNKELELTKALITLGKPGIQVAVISRRPQGYFLVHIESDGDAKRYPIVNGKPVGPKAYKLNDRDIIELAGIKIEFSNVN